MEDKASKLFVDTVAPTHPMAGASGTGSALFVINLCASIAPLQNVGRSLPGLDNFRLYQVARIEDGRPRHRLRLGFFTSESHAQSVLTIVRQQYPTAFTTSLCDEDRRFARGYLPESAAATPSTAAATRPAARSAARTSSAATPSPEKVKSAAAVARPANSPSPAASQTSMQPVTSSHAPSNRAPSSPAPSHQTPANQTPAKAPASQAPVPGLTLAEPDPVVEQTPRAPAQPFHVGRGVEIGELGITLLSDPPVAKPAGHIRTAAANLPAAGTVSPGVAQPAYGQASASNLHFDTSASPAPVTSITAAAPRSGVDKAPRRSPLRRPDLDSTQTIRALTSAELNDDTGEKWFAIQLAASEQPVNLDAMPHLDIFEAYRLYSVATAGSGKIVHSLRLGFFREAVSAEAVSGYLKTFFGSPTVMRISAAEHARFKEPPARRTTNNAPRKEAEVIELSDARASRPVVPTLTMETPAPRVDSSDTGAFRPGATGSFEASASGAHRLTPAAKSAGAIRRSQPVSRKSTTGKYKMPVQKKSLSQQLLDEAREVALSESGVRKLPKNESLFSRLVGKLTK